VSIAELVHLRRARDTIDWGYAQALDVPAMARAAHMSPSHFARRYRQVFGETPYQHLVSRRVERAQALLRAGTLPVSEVCHAVGFSSLAAFNARFRELTGVCPRLYRATCPVEPAGVPACMLRGIARRTAPDAVVRAAGTGGAAQSSRNQAV
jgi:AraC-like DNA-binding protein